MWKGIFLNFGDKANNDLGEDFVNEICESCVGWYGRL